MQRIGAWACLAVLAGGGILAGSDAVSDAARAELTRERRRLSADLRSLSEVSRRLESAVNQLAGAVRAVSDAANRGDAPEDLTRRDEAVAAAEQDVRALLERRRILADRVIERRRTVAALESDLSGRRMADSLSGRWSVLIDPGEQKGVFNLTLNGTLVSGEYSLEGGYSGSLRGTLVNDRLRLERVDSRQGFSAIYYGRLVRDDATISGTWETTTYAAGTPESGAWREAREEEKEENP